MLEILSIKPEAVITSTTAGINFGTWIPSLVSAGKIDMNIRNSFYVKAERLVVCTFDLEIMDMPKEKNNSSIVLQGLPNVSMFAPVYSGSLIVSYFTVANSDIQSISGAVKSNDVRVELWCQQKTQTGLRPLLQSDINIGTVLTGTVIYITSS